MTDLPARLHARHGVVGLVLQTRQAVSAAERQRATLCVAALTRVELPNDQAALRAAGGADALAAALDAFRADVQLAQWALTALERAWATRGPAVPTAAVVRAVLRAMAAHGFDLLAVQCGLRLLRLHTAGEACVVEAPQVLDAVALAMRGPHRADPTVRRWGAECATLLSGLEPASVRAAHGEVGELRMAATSVALAVESAARPPPALLVGQGEPWYTMVLACHPRLRERA